MKKCYPLPLQVEKLEDGRRRLLAPFKYQNRDKLITVPAGFEFDGASIPKFAWSIIGGPFSSGNFRPSVIHDFLCVTEDHPLYDRRHDIFYEMLKIEGKSWWKRKIMKIAVVIWGWVG